MQPEQSVFFALYHPLSAKTRVLELTATVAAKMNFAFSLTINFVDILKSAKKSLLFSNSK